jgi:hypothetical protein
VNWSIGADGKTTKVTITHAATAAGPIVIQQIQRTYPLTFLATFQSNKVEAAFQLFNDPHIVLTDANSTNRDLNVTTPIVLLTTLSNKDFARPPITNPETPRTVVSEIRAAVRQEVIQTLPVQFNRLQDLNLARDDSAVEGAALFLVAVGPDGQEGTRVPLPVSDLKNLSGLLERLRKAQIPSALYRLYYQEPGLPPQLVLEFRKTGNTIGDPVREPGRGTNPIDQPPPPQQPAADPNAQNNSNTQNNSMGQWQQPAQPQDATIAIESAIAQAAQQSFSRTARLLRSWMR